MSGRQVQVTSSSVGTSVCACEDDGLLAEAMGYPHQLAAGAMKELHRVLDRHIRREVLYRNAKTWITSSEPTSLSRTNRRNTYDASCSFDSGGMHNSISSICEDSTMSSMSADGVLISNVQRQSVRAPGAARQLPRTWLLQSTRELDTLVQLAFWAENVNVNN